MKTIHITKDEDIISIIDKVKREKEDRINLVIPEKAEIFQNLVNLILLKREADNLNKEIFIITSDKTGKRLAEKVGFLVKFEPFEEKEEKEEKEVEKEENKKGPNSENKETKQK